MIPVKETKEFDKCVFCLTPTKLIHSTTKKAICKSCADTHEIKDIKALRP
jgi:hypothetical protein